MLEAFVGFGVFVFAEGCGASKAADGPGIALPAQIPDGTVPGRAPFADNVDALTDVLLPAEFSADGAMTSPGAREAGVDSVLQIDDFATLAVAQGLVTPLSDDAIARLGVLGAAFRAAMNADLDLLALRQRPLTAFRDLPRELQEAVVDDALADDARKPVMLVVRAACFCAYLGAVSNDLGLRAVGFPAFESFADGLAVSGYPRTKEGRLVDIATENLAALAASGDLDDYTYNRAPTATTGDDLSTVLDANGDLL